MENTEINRIYQICKTKDDELSLALSEFHFLLAEKMLILLNNEKYEEIKKLITKHLIFVDTPVDIYLNSKIEYDQQVWGELTCINAKRFYKEYDDDIFILVVKDYITTSHRRYNFLHPKTI